MNFIAGPFKNKPCENFRCNSLFAIEQGSKVRPIMNMSAPLNESFNDAIIQDELPKVTMSSIKKVCEAVYNLGKGCILSKLDHIAAYKMIPAKPEQYRLQGFAWLTMYFIELRQTFGSCSSVFNYDVFHKLFCAIIRELTHTKDESLFRVLDDLIVITKTLDENKNFVETYIKTAKELNIPLAETNNAEKSFVYQTRGTVLGISIDTANMTWSLGTQKIHAYKFQIQRTINAKTVSLKELQSVNGILNTIVQLCPTLKFWRTPILADMSQARYKEQKIQLSMETKLCLSGWMRILNSLKNGFPIPEPMREPPEHILCFVTDAAGIAKNTELKHEIGVGACGFWKPNNEIIYVGQEFWESNFITTTFDQQGKFIGCKTTLLEIIGWILPLYHMIQTIKNKRVLILVDNVASVFGYENGKSRQDPWASFMLNAINFVLVRNQVKLYVQHLRRVSTFQAILADALTRKDKQGIAFVQKQNTKISRGWPPALTSWMKNPTLNQNFKHELLNNFETKRAQI